MVDVRTITEPQAVYDFVSAHLIKQAKAATFVDEDGDIVCAYRASDGCVCAVGSLIADDEYTPEFEGKSVYTLVDANFSDHPVIKRFEKNVDLLARLQCVHDNYLRNDDAELTLTKAELRKVADEHKLTVNFS